MHGSAMKAMWRGVALIPLVCSEVQLCSPCNHDGDDDESSLMMVVVMMVVVVMIVTIILG